MARFQPRRARRGRLSHRVSGLAAPARALADRILATRAGAFLAAALSAVTPVGWAVVAGVVAALVVVQIAGWLEAGVVVVVGLVCLAVGIGSVLGRSWYRVEVHLPHSRVRVGQTAFGELRAHNPRSYRTGAGIIELPVGPTNAPFAVPGLAAGEHWSEVFAVPARRRGVVLLGPARTVRGDALGLLLRVQEWTRPVRLLVHPRTVRVPFDATGFQADVEGVTTARLSSSDVSFHALRDYAPGDDRRHVHWPTTARVGRLTVRQFEETRRSHHLIVLDDRADSWPGDSFETAVSTVASLALPGLSAGRRVSVATSGGWLSTASPTRLMDALTELEPVAAAALGLTDRLRQVLAERRGASVLTVVCGPGVTDAEAAHWSARAGSDVETGVVRVCPGRSPARRTLGRTVVADCPELDDLPRLLYRIGATP